MSEKKPKPLAVYYETNCKRGSYWLEMPDGSYITLGISDIQRWMMRQGVNCHAKPGELSDFDKLILHAQEKGRVKYAGPLAGHRKGLHETTGGWKVLVTEENPIYSAKTKLGKTPFFLGFVKALFKEKVQIDYILDWLAMTLQRLTKGEFGPGHALVLVGKSGCGKSLFQHVVTEVLGGRKADPWRYMTGQTPFNADLAEVEHLMIEDKSSSTDIKSRREFGVILKEMVVNRDMSIHPKGGQAFTFYTFRRVTFTVNDEAENLAVLPPLDESILEKIALLKCHDATGSLAPTEPETMRRFIAEMPAIRAMLMRREVPKERANKRYGVNPYHHPEVLDTAQTLEPCVRLLNLIDQVFDLSGSSEKITSEKLEAILMKSEYSFSAQQLFRYSSACGSYMGKLAKTRPDRVEKRVTDGKTSWIIKAPTKGEN